MYERKIRGILIMSQGDSLLLGVHVCIDFELWLLKVRANSPSQIIMIETYQTLSFFL